MYIITSRAYKDFFLNWILCNFCCSRGHDKNPTEKTRCELHVIAVWTQLVCIFPPVARRRCLLNVVQKFLGGVVESACADALWQCAVLRVTRWIRSFAMSQSQPSIQRAGLSPHASHQPDFDGHMLPLCLAARSFEETQQKWQQWLGRHTHTRTRPGP